MLAVGTDWASCYGLEFFNSILSLDLEKINVLLLTISNKHQQ